VTPGSLQFPLHVLRTHSLLGPLSARRYWPALHDHDPGLDWNGIRCPAWSESRVDRMEAEQAEQRLPSTADPLCRILGSGLSCRCSGSTGNRDNWVPRCFVWDATGHRRQVPSPVRPPVTGSPSPLRRLGGRLRWSGT